jgi:hypothetical protein
MGKSVYLAAGTSILLTHIMLCFFLRYRTRRMIWWCLPVSLVLALTYALSIWYIAFRYDALPYSGLHSDASFAISYVNNVINGNYFGDFYEKDVPSHYPPLYFWILGTVARLIGTDAKTAWITAPVLVLAVLPFTVFRVGRAIGGDRIGFYASFAFFALGSAITSYLFSRREFPPMNWGIHKPYEILAGVFALAWLVDVIRATEANEGPKGGQYATVARQGVNGGVVFLLYYPWFALTAAALFCLLLVDYIRDRAPVLWKIRHVVMVSLVSLVVGAPFWLPYVSALLQNEHDPSHGWRHITLSFFDITRVTVGLGYCGSLFVLGVYGFLENWRRNRIARGIGVLVCLLYCWFASTYITWPLLHTNVLSAKASMLIFVSMCFGTALTLDRLSQWNGLRLLLLSPFLLSLCSLVLLPTFVQWNTRTDERLARAVGSFPIPVRELVRAIGGKEKELTALVSARLAYELPTVSRIRLFLSPNIFFSNPLARFEKRKKLVEDLGRLESGTLSSRLTDLRIGLVVLEKEGNGSFSLLIQNSSLPSSIFDTDRFYYDKVTFAPGQFSRGDFSKVFEDEQTVAFLVGATG